jgi:hypothetical protein
LSKGAHGRLERVLLKDGQRLRVSFLFLMILLETPAGSPLSF